MTSVTLRQLSKAIDHLHDDPAAGLPFLERVKVLLDDDVTLDTPLDDSELQEISFLFLRILNS